MYHDRLAADGYDVVDAPDGMEAVAALRSGRVDLVVLDLIMPRMGGMEVLEIMRYDPTLSGIPVLVLTNLDETDSADRAVEMGAVAYLIKNHTKPADISARVREILADPSRAVVEAAGPEVFDVFIQARMGDAGQLIEHARLPHGLWCPACEVPLTLSLVERPDSGGWYDAHFVCRECGRDFGGQRG
jgi:DNA-binding response OmpR family regulator